MARDDIVKISENNPAGEELVLEEDMNAPAMEIEFEGEEEKFNEQEEISPFLQHNANLADFLAEDPEGDSLLEEVSSNLMELFDADKESRSEWDSISSEAVGLLGFKIEEPDRPFAGACGASHPVLSQAVVKFQAKAYKELFPSQGPVRTRIMGAVTPEKEQQSLRVKEFLNYQTTQLMPEYGPQLDKLLFHTALYGSTIKKTYWDVPMNRPASRLVKAEDFVIDYYADDLETAERYTHVMKLTSNEIKKNQIAGQYRDVELGTSSDVDLTDTDEEVDEVHGRSQPNNMFGDQHTVLEMHIDMEIPGFEHPDGLLLPYIVVIEKDSQKVLSIRRNWREGDPDFSKKVYFTHYTFVPGLGFYGYGYLHLIGGLSKTATTSLRQLTDAGTFSNLPAGFKAHGLRMLAPDEPLSPGEWREANAPAGDLNKSLVPLPYKEPSRTLFELMKFMVETAKEFADQTDVVVAESSNYGPVGTTLALLEQSGKLFSAIHQRMHAAQGHDLKLLAELNFEFMPEQYPYQVSNGDQNIFKADFDPMVIDVVPVSDPNMPTEAHRVAKLNAILTTAMQDPGSHDMNAIRLDMYRAMGVDQPERYMKQQQQPYTGDPVTENSMALVGTPLRADPVQSDDAHIVTHAMLMQNPAFEENQGMKQIMLAHINEHLASKHRKEMIEMIAQRDPQAAEALMSNQQKFPPEMEQMIAIAAMEASDSVLKLDEAKARAMAGKSSDPIIEQQEREQDLQETKQNQDYNLAVGDQSLKEAEIMIDDQNADDDRAMKLRIEKLKLIEKGSSNG